MKKKKEPRIQPEAAIKAALDILEEDGLESVTLRRIATKLNVQAPALYWHFQNKQDIIDDMAHFILADNIKNVCKPSIPEKWADWLFEMAHTLRNALLSHREGARIVAGAGLARARALAELAELTTGVMREAGFDACSAGIATTTIISYTFGYVIEEQSAPSLEPENIEDLYVQFPHLAAAHRAKESLSAAELFDRGLYLIIQSLGSSKQLF